MFRTWNSFVSRQKERKKTGKIKMLNGGKMRRNFLKKKNDERKYEKIQLHLFDVQRELELIFQFLTVQIKISVYSVSRHGWCYDRVSSGWCESIHKNARNVCERKLNQLRSTQPRWMRRNQMRMYRKGAAASNEFLCLRNATWMEHSGKFSTSRCYLSSER